MEGEPKTKRSRRTVPLDAELVRVLRAHRERQLFEKRWAGAAWTDTGFVFVREDGLPYFPAHFSTAWERHIARLGLRPIRFHDARHTAATLALRAAVPVEIVSRWLGHHSAAFTSDVHQHEVPQLMEEAGETVTALVSRHRMAR